MIPSLSKFFCIKSKSKPDRRLNALIEFSLKMPQALDPEKLADAISQLKRFGWNAQKAALHVNNTQLKDFDDAMMDKGDDPLEFDSPPGPSC